MARQYGAFLVRYWRLADGDRRLAVAHIQSGASARVASLAAALDWMAAYLPGDDAAGAARDAPSPAGDASGTQEGGAMSCVPVSKE